MHVLEFLIVISIVLAIIVVGLHHSYISREIEGTVANDKKLYNEAVRLGMSAAESKNILLAFEETVRAIQIIEQLRGRAGAEGRRHMRSLPVDETLDILHRQRDALLEKLREAAPDVVTVDHPLAAAVGYNVLQPKVPEWEEDEDGEDGEDDLSEDEDES